MRYESPESDPVLRPGGDDSEVTRTSPGRVPSGPRPADPRGPSPPVPTDLVPRPPPAEIVRFGPGVPATPPAGQAELTAEPAWHRGGPARPSRRLVRLRQAAWHGAHRNLACGQRCRTVPALSSRPVPRDRCDPIPADGGRLRGRPDRPDNDQRFCRDGLLPVAVPGKPAPAPSVEPVGRRWPACRVRDRRGRRPGSQHPRRDGHIAGSRP